MDPEECPRCGGHVFSRSSRCDECASDASVCELEASADSNDLMDALGGVGGFLCGFLGGLAGGIVSELARDAEHYQEDMRMRRNIEEAMRSLE